jgi:hypothetical protein
MNNIQQRIQEIKTKGYDLDFSDVFNQTIENYKKIAILGGMSFIIFSIFIGMIFGGGFVLLSGANSMAENLANFNISSFSIVDLLIYLVTLVFISCITAPFYSGILKMAYLADQNEEFDIGTATEYYKGNYFKELVTSSAIISLFSVGLTVLLEKAGIPFVGAFLSYVISFMMFFVNTLIIFGNLKAIEAINASLVVVSKKIPLLIALIVVALVICFLGFIGLCIGIFFTMPFIFSMKYIIFKNIFDLKQVSEIDEIGAFQE